MDATELIAWIGWAVTAGLWAWRASRRPPVHVCAPWPIPVDTVSSEPEPVSPPAVASVDTGARHRLDTWTAALHAPDGVIVALRHGRGTVPAALIYPLSKSLAVRTYTYRAADDSDPSVHHFDVGS